MNIHGLAIPYNVPASPEYLRSSAWTAAGLPSRTFHFGDFAAALARPKIRRTYLTLDDQDDSLRLASVGAGSLRLWETAAGLMFEATLTGPQAPLVYELIFERRIQHVCAGILAPWTDRAALVGLKLLLDMDPGFPGTWCRVGSAA